MRRLFEENERMKLIEQSREFVLDQEVSRKMFERHAKRVDNNEGQNFHPTYSTIYDFEPKATLRSLQASTTNSTSNSTKPDESDDPRNNPDMMPDIELFSLSETYPSKDQTCMHGGLKTPLTQNYFTCFQNSAPDNEYRVTFKTFQDLTTYPYFR